MVGTALESLWLRLHISKFFFQFWVFLEPERYFEVTSKVSLDLPYIEMDMSKGSSGVPFGHIFFQSACFFYLSVVEKFQTRRLKAEIVYFRKIKFSRTVEYSTAVEYSTNFHLWTKITVSIRQNYGKNKKFQFQSPNVV